MAIPTVTLLATVIAFVSASSPLNVTKLDCGFRKLALEQARKIQPFRTEEEFESVFKALELGRLCGETMPKRAVPAVRQNNQHNNSVCSAVHVNPVTGNDDTHPGTFMSPFASIERALQEIRSERFAQACANDKKTVVLSPGMHYINKTIELTAADSNTHMVSSPDGMAWISGGVSVPSMEWKPTHEGSKLWVATLAEAWAPKEVTGLFTERSHVRLTRARYPNANIETTTWGYASPDRFNVSIQAQAVSEWIKPPVGKAPTFETIDLSVPNPSGYIKNDSTMSEYNTWTTGRGGVCDTVWNPGQDSYWCSNGSAGGWAEVDAACATAGQLQLPVGMEIDTKSANLSRMLKWKNPAGAIVHAWHSQSWATHMFRVDKQSKGLKGETTLSFSSGGQQGGRNWCRCDQCTYAGSWCGQHQTPPKPDTRLISGSWYVEGVLEELDQPGEWHYDSTTRELTVWPNSTETVKAVEDMVVPIVQTLVRIDGKGDAASGTVSGITFEGIGFRDSVATYMAKEWSAPSGGDWSLYHGGAMVITNAEDVNITECVFRRLDGNAIYLPGKSRDVRIEKNSFEWLGENAVTTNGDSEKWDARAGEQPRKTLVSQNIMHDLGLYEKQSSAWGQNKACLANVSNNIMYNLPRAAINFNDALGGGNLISKNLLWNTCRESGDHGAMNSWNRQPFLHDLRGEPSFNPLPTTIENNFVFANYGSSQGVDNDDGSSWFDSHDNVFYMADGFKMDYGGHDSKFHDNLVVNYPYDGQNCVNVGGFEQRHGDGFYGNKCLAGIGGKQKPSGCGDPSCFTGDARGVDVVGHVAQCDPEYIRLGNNSYYTPHGNVTLGCGSKELLIADVQKQFNVEIGSTSAVLPSDEEIVDWARIALGL
eukprot:m.52629 g.52629  ORF g.52629 m.52629 type:complete len:878 (+) comp21637_c0_seq1:31-2664(+)